MNKPLRLTKRYNADNTISLLCRGRVVMKVKNINYGDLDSFARGWFGGSVPRWGKPQFRDGKKA